MINEFRTLLLNLPYNQDKSEYIPEEFTGFTHTAAMKDFYDLLYPARTSRFYKAFLTHNYLSMISAAGLENYIVRDDSRVTYDLNNNIQFFKFNRNTNPIVNDPNHELVVSGDYINSVQNNNFYEIVLIKQKGNTATVDISSKLNNQFFKKDQVVTFPTPISTANTGASAPIAISNTGLSFQIISYVNFTSTINKSWEFITEAPFAFNFNAFYSNLKANNHIITRMLDVPGKHKDTTPENLWNQHYNPVYKVAGLLIAFVDRINV